MIIMKQGALSFYTVQCMYRETLSTKDSRWVAIGADHILAVPDELRLDYITGRRKEPFRSYSSVGEVFRCTDNLGFEDIDTALEMARILSEHNPEDTFRVVRVYISMSIAPLVHVGAKSDPVLGQVG